MARYADLSRGLPGQAIFSRSQPNGRFIKAGPARWPFYQGLALTARKAAMFISLSKFYQGRQAQWPFYQGQPSPMAALSRLASANGRFINEQGCKRGPVRVLCRRFRVYLIRFLEDARKAVLGFQLEASKLKTCRPPSAVKE